VANRATTRQEWRWSSDCPGPAAVDKLCSTIGRTMRALGRTSKSATDSCRAIARTLHEVGRAVVADKKERVWDVTDS
jgi:hypothetical protein